MDIFGDLTRSCGSGQIVKPLQNTSTDGIMKLPFANRMAEDSVVFEEYGLSDNEVRQEIYT